MNDHDKHSVGIEQKIADVLEDARDGILDADQLEAARQLLLKNAAARHYYIGFNSFNQLLESVENSKTVFDLSQPGEGESASARIRAFSLDQTFAPNRFKVSKKTKLLGTVAAALVVVFVLFALWPASPPITTPLKISATLNEIQGRVSVASADAEIRLVETRIKIGDGDTIRTHGPLSSAVLTYADGTRLSLVGSTTLTTSASGRKSIILHTGTMFASVTPQPADRPMLIVTPQEQVQVLGTTFSLNVLADKTDLNVTEGRVKLTRLHDGSSVEVPAGQHVVSDTSQASLDLQAIPDAPDRLLLDFETGLPSGWDVGQFATTDLPAGSRGAIRPEFQSTSDGESFAIVSHAKWLRGMFAVHDDSHLKLTFKMSAPNWINIFVVTRTPDSARPRFANNFQFNEVPFRRLNPGNWYEIAIPFSQFQRLPGFTSNSLQQLLPFSIVINSTLPDRGLVIDDIEVTRGGPGVVTLKQVIRKTDNTSRNN